MKLIMLLVALTLTPLASTAQAYVLVTNDLGQPVFWPTRCVSWFINPNVIEEVTPEEALALTESAYDAWSDNPCSYVRTQSAGFTCFDEAGLADFPGPQNVVMWRDGQGGWPYTERVIALTGLIYDNVTAEIVDADIEVNGDMFSFATDGSTNAYDLQQALTHEVGHTLGLEHSLDERATMFWLSAPGETGKRVLTDDDTAGLCASHPIADAPAEPVCDGTPPPATLAEPYCPEDDADPNCAAGPTPLALSVVVGLSFLYLRRRSRDAACGA